jgi:hypothetical protein
LICIAEVDTIPVSRKVILADLLKSLRGGAHTFVIRRTSAGFHGYAKADVYGIKGNTRFCELYSDRPGYFKAEDLAGEDAAEGLI